MCFTKQVIKPGVLYSDVVKYLRPFDVIFFRGNKIYSKVISALEKRSEYPGANEFTHVGMIITSDVVDHPNVKPGKFYLYESVVSGYFGYGVGDIEGHQWWWGVQIRDLEEIVNACDKYKTTITAYGRLINNPLDRLSITEAKARFMEFYTAHIGIRYDVNPYSLLSSIFAKLRPCRDKIEHFVDSESWLFCSELVAAVLKHMGVYSSEINERDVLPRDIAFPETDTDVMPKILSHLIHVTTPQYYNGNDVVQL